MTQNDQSAAGVEQDKVITACRDCDYVDAIVVDDLAEIMGTEEDPGFRHYDATDHRCGSFEPTEGSLLEEQWEAAYGLADASNLIDSVGIFELATEIEA